MRRCIFIVLAVTLITAGCGNGQSARQVRLDRTGPGVPATLVDPASKPIRIAAVSMISPQETVRSYGVFFAYIEKKLGRRVDLVQRRTYEESYDLLRYGSLDVAMICTYVYILGRKEIGMELLAGPQVNGKAEYQSFIITRADSGIHRFEDLAGKRFAFTDPLSTSGRAYPLSRLKQMGKEPGTYFTSTTYTYSHDNSIKAVAQGVVDGAAVDSLVYDQWVLKDPELALKLRVIERSEAFPSPPFVASPRLNPQIRGEIQAILLTMHEDPEGAQILASLNIDRWVIQHDADYDSVRRVAALAGMGP